MKIADISVKYIEHMGSDLSVVNAARVSFDKESHELNDKDIKLIKYLAKHDHWSPFAHTSIQLRIKAPIFVARQLVKHQVGGVWNEISRRYVDYEPEFYFPKEWRLKADNKKQGSSNEICEYNELHKEEFSRLCSSISDIYKMLIDTNICPEQSRMILPQNTMTEWIWTGSLLFFSRVCNLRLDEHAQKETQDVARLILSILQEHYPVCTEELINEL